MKKINKTIGSLIIAAALSLNSCESFNETMKQAEHDQIVQERKKELKKYMPDFWEERKDIPKAVYLDFWKTKTAERKLLPGSLEYNLSYNADTAKVFAEYVYQKPIIENFIEVPYFEYEIKDRFVFDGLGWNHDGIEYRKRTADNRNEINAMKNNLHNGVNKY